MNQATVTTDLRELTTEIGTWGDATFPRDDRDAAVRGCLAHLDDEVYEFREAMWTGAPDASKTEELADVFILAFQIAHLLGIDAAQAIHDKMAVNRNRTWGERDSRGVIRHVEQKE